MEVLDSTMRFSNSSSLRLAFALVLLSSLPRPTAAAVRYIAPSGTASNTGSSTSSPWSLAKANSTLAPGDVCIVLPGSYPAGDVAPVNHGLPGNRITFVGDIRNPGAAVVNGGVSTDRSYLSIKGIRFTGGVTLNASSPSNTAMFDSVAHCEMKSIQFAGAKRNMVARNRITNPTGSVTVGYFLDGFKDTPGTGFNSACEADTLRGNLVDCGYITWKAFIMRTFTQRCVIDSNQISARFQGTNPDIQGRYLYNSYYNTFRDNRWTFEADNAATGAPWNCFSLRDSSAYNLFERDTMLCGLQSGVPMHGRLMNAGVEAWNGNTSRNVWRDCLFKMTAYLFVHINGNGTVLERCTVINTKSGPAITFNDAMAYQTIDHCTFASKDGRAVWFGTIKPGTPSDSVRFTSNIVYSEAVNSGDGVLAFPGTSGFFSNWNVVHTPSFGSTPGDRSVYAAGTIRTVPAWCSASTRDCQSRSGNPLFIDAGLATFNPRLIAGSIAIGAGQNGSDAGAYPFGVGGADLTPPATVSNLAASNALTSSVQLTWTAPGDDGYSGVATSYELRWSTSPISAANFASATAVNPQPSPASGGSAQSFTVTGLQPGVSYFMALRARDEVGNESGVSNTVSFNTQSADTTAPAAILDLTASP